MDENKACFLLIEFIVSTVNCVFILDLGEFRRFSSAAASRLFARVSYSVTFSPSGRMLKVLLKYFTNEKYLVDGWITFVIVIPMGE